VAVSYSYEGKGEEGVEIMQRNGKIWIWVVEDEQM
jgi:hypothetical protein